MPTNLMLTHYLPTLTFWHWYGVAIVLLILEFLLMTSGFLLWLSLAAAIVGVLLWMFPFFDWPYQVLIFSLVGIVSSVVWWSYLLRHHPVRKRRRRGEQFIGQVFVLSAPVKSERGTLQTWSGPWHVVGPDLTPGVKVKVVRVQQGNLQVEKVD